MWWRRQPNNVRSVAPVFYSPLILYGKSARGNAKKSNSIPLPMGPHVLRYVLWWWRTVKYVRYQYWCFAMQATTIRIIIFIIIKIKLHFLTLFSNMIYHLHSGKYHGMNFSTYHPPLKDMRQEVRGEWHQKQEIGGDCNENPKINTYVWNNPNFGILLVRKWNLYCVVWSLNGS